MYRAKRYTDASNPLVKRSGPQFPVTYDFPFARKALTTSIETVRQLLKIERAKNPRYEAVWQEATKIFTKKRHFLVSHAKAPIPDECHIALIAYTYEKPLSNGTSLEIYVDFNKQCRLLKDETSWMKFPYKSFYCLLGKAVSSVQSLPDNNQPPYYRGVSFHYDSNFPNEEILVDFSQFTSCSQNREKALQFIRQQGKKGTLLMLPHPPMAGIGIKNYSQFPDEEEVLICPWSTFTIRHINRNGDIHEIALSSEGPYFDHLPYTMKKAAPMSVVTGFKQMFGFS